MNVLPFSLVLKLAVAAVVTLGLNAQSAAGAPDTPSQEEMLEYLKIDATTEGRCFYTQKHYIDLDVDIHSVHRIVPTSNGLEYDYLTPSELQALKAQVEAVPGFSLREIDELGLLIDVTEGTTRSELIRGLYLLKKKATSLSPTIFVQSTQDCPITVGVGDL